MSATLRVDDFISNPRLFKDKPPVINVESRQFPVTIHFNRKTNEDYVKEALRKTVKIHTQLPEGGILIFLTGKYNAKVIQYLQPDIQLFLNTKILIGQREVNTVVRRLRKAFPFREKKWAKKSQNKKSQKKDKKKTDEGIASDEDYNSDEEFFSKGSKNRHKKTLKPAKLPQVNLDA